MVRTRGGRERPTASVRRGDKCDEAVEAGGFPSAPSNRFVLGIPKCPSDRFVLVIYPDHIAFRLWTGEVRYLQFLVLCW